MQIYRKLRTLREPTEPLQRERVVSNFLDSALARAFEVPAGRHVPGKGSLGGLSARPPGDTRSTFA